MSYDSIQAANAEGSLYTTLDLEENGQTELFSVPIEGPAEASEKLNGPLVSGGSVLGWDLSQRNQVAYKADQDKLDVHELYLADLPKYTLFLPLLLR